MKSGSDGGFEHVVKGSYIERRHNEYVEIIGVNME